MDFQEQLIKGVFIIHNFNPKDNRGQFIKTYHKDAFEKIGFKSSFVESYYSFSHRNVLRGMHFQLPPHDHEKLVYVTAGKILDVVLDLRESSTTYGKAISFELNEFSSSILIPKGCAHGFLTLSDNATVVYNVTSVYNSNSDSGILWNSFGFNWGISQPITSERDASFESFINIKSIF